ncbi:probable L-gulonolactone oxidase 6 [Ricinus communis]|uniref:L-gulonolactone oxidase n=1 Tax=Ricinus communis TaxID=3988 RepID=B9S3D0_RICCO|nr:probable L-gulonolactone oxidase 6 [Ricinus communis]EEF41912.1 d-lactate dehydrogenase, putative [Ricinus communis]|eukprot:XP_002520499.1 probable L-gulonolactone oxidase 6 [Ricinus communis]
MGTFRLLLRLTCLFLLFFIVISTPPEDPIECTSRNTNCTITNSYGTFPDRSICQAANVAYPTTEEELISVVANATKAKRKMKVATRYSHSIPKLVCPDGKDGLLISTKNLNHVLSIDVQSMTMTVESGVTLRQIIDEGANAGLALPYAPYWWGLTIGGLLGTGAHGSTLWGIGSSVHDYVVGLTIVSPGGPENGYANVRILDEKNSEFNAAKVSLGVLGVISKVTLKLQPLFKRSITYVAKDDTDLGDQATSFGLQHEFADITWYPTQSKAIYRIDDRISSNTSGNGLYDFIPFRSTLSLGLSVIRATEENQEALGDVEGRCISARLTTGTLLTAAYGLTNRGILFTGYPVIGFHNRLQSSGTCLDSREDALITACPWDSRIKGEYFHQTTFSISLSNVKSFIQDVQQLVKLEPKGLCTVEQYNGILMRYVKASTAYLGKQEDAIDFDITYYRSKDPLTPRMFEDILEEIEQIAVFKYGALPHWGKNRNAAFSGAITRYKNAGEFLRVKQMYDPTGLFSSEWTDQVLGLKEGLIIVKEGCALEGLCICSEDSHCAPKKGYLCRPGKVYQNARVCTLVTT